MLYVPNGSALVPLLIKMLMQSLPHNGAGAGQAIEDAYILGELLKLPECTADTIPQFLHAYENARRERASNQQIHSRESGEVGLL
jgi:salicylate hydroxylase